MKMTGEQSIAAPRAKAWEALNDPEVLKQCIPGCQSLERDGDNRFKAVVAIKVGPIGAKFNGAVTLSDIDAPNGYTLSGEGQGGPAGFAKGSAQVRLTEEGPQSTKLAYDVDAQVGGKIAQLGGAVIDATAKQLAGSFFKKFGQIVGAPAAAEAASPAPEPAQATQAAPPPAAPLAPAAAPAAPAVSAAAVAAANAQQGQSAPWAWILALVVATFVAYFIGAGGGGDWTGVAVGLLVLVAAAAGFEFGRRAAAPVVILDPEQLQRLIAKKSGGDA